MSSPPAAPRRVMGLDYGTARVGVAVSDGLGVTAGPVEVIPRRHPRLLERLAEIMEEYGAEAVVVGLPVSLDGSEHQSAAAARRFAAEVEKALAVTVEFYDERFTTRIAEEALAASGAGRARRRGAVDKVAAAVMLQGYLDRRGLGAVDAPKLVERRR